MIIGVEAYYFITTEYTYVCLFVGSGMPSIHPPAFAVHSAGNLAQS